MYLLFCVFICFAYLEDCDEESFSDGYEVEKPNGRLYMYETEDDCNDRKNCLLLWEAHRGKCTEFTDDDETFYQRFECDGSSKIYFASYCESDECDYEGGDCGLYVEDSFGDCEEIEEDSGAFYRVEGCNTADDILIGIGAGLMGLGVICFLCAICLCPLGLTLLIIGCCISCNCP